MQLSIVDYETYYDKSCSITTLGTRGYFQHPDFDAYMVAIDGPDFQYVGHPKDAPWDRISGPGHVWGSHNASFDECLQRFLIEKGILPPSALPETWDCSADMVAYFGCPRSLKDSTKAILGIELSKATRDSMAGKRWENMSPEFQQEVTDYALDDCIYSRKLFDACYHLWPEHERRLSRQTRRIGWRGVPIDEAKLDASIEMLEIKKIEFLDSIPWAKGDGEGALSSIALAKACREINVEPPSSVSADNEDCVQWMARYDGTQAVEWVKAVRSFRSITVLLKKLHAMRDRTFDGWMDFNLKYAGAHTLRWSGGGGFNMQNMPKGEMFGVDMRSLIRAPEGYTLVTCDLSQIEPRTLHCLAGDEAFIGRLRANPKADLYDTQSRAWKMYDQPEELKVGDPKLRHKVKTLNIGLGYKMGPTPFAFATGFTLEEAKYWVDFYQRVNPLICGLWQRLIEAFIDSVHSADRTFNMQLPLRTMRYRRCSNSRGLTCVLNKNGRFIEQRVWVGILIENLVQAFARDVFGWKLLEIEDAGYDLLWHVHDEGIWLVKIEDAERAKHEIEEIMCRDVSWCQEAGLDLPLGAEATITPFYQKS